MIFLFTELGELGGAATESWDLLRLLQSRGTNLTVVSEHEPSLAWRKRLAATGCGFLRGTEQSLDAIPGLADSIAIGVCSRRFLANAETLRAMRCRRIWVSCMPWILPQETLLYAHSGLFEAHVFQSRYQRAQLRRAMSGYGYRPSLGHVIRGAFELGDWEFAPRKKLPRGEFIVGKLARPDWSKWSRRTWEMLGRIDHPCRRALLMGVDDTIRKWLGPAPNWADVLPPCAIPTHEFYRRLHCLVAISHSAIENWPRVGLEAMASGVPIIAPRGGGWCEMIAHGETGFLAASIDEVAAFATQLARDEPLRLRIATQARQRLTDELARPDRIWRGWKKLFAQLLA